jgi:hypothetical protein
MRKSAETVFVKFVCPRRQPRSGLTAALRLQSHVRERYDRNTLTRANSVRASFHV